MVDFNKNCEEQRGKYLPLSGRPVYYYQCGTCSLVFTTAFDKWSKSEFIEHIYNEGYIEVDPGYLEERPASNARLVSNFVKHQKELHILDYGGGNGRLSEILNANGFHTKSWDPMDSSATRPDSGKFYVVTAFEVFEHTPTPIETFVEATEFLNNDGVLLFSTLTIDNLPPRACYFWYISPRNGHITIFTKRSLKILAEKFGYRIHHMTKGLHLAYRQPPAWLKRG